jgi:hypothetical protein
MQEKRAIRIMWYTESGVTEFCKSILQENFLDRNCHYVKV